MLVSLYFLIVSRSPFRGSLVLILNIRSLRITINALRLTWLFYVVLIVFIGGLIILFLYMCSLINYAQVEVMNLKVKAFIRAVRLFLIRRISRFPLNDRFATFRCLINIFARSNLWVFSHLIGYLLTGLILAVKISSKIAGPLKTFTHD